MRTGSLIALEGLDGSGTTTQSQALAEALRERGHQVLTTHEPTDSVVGQHLRRQLGATSPPKIAMALLFAADRALHLAETIEPALARGELVICDRYLLSSWVYQSMDCPPDWVRAINRHALWPSLTLLLDVPADVGMRRVAQRRSAREIFETPAIQRRVAAGYRAILEEGLPGLVKIDADRAPDEVTAALVHCCVEIGL